MVKVELLGNRKERSEAKRLFPGPKQKALLEGKRQWIWSNEEDLESRMWDGNVEASRCWIILTRLRANGFMARLESRIWLQRMDVRWFNNPLSAFEFPILGMTEAEALRSVDADSFFADLEQAIAETERVLAERGQTDISVDQLPQIDFGSSTPRWTPRLQNIPYKTEKKRPYKLPPYGEDLPRRHYLVIAKMHGSYLTSVEIGMDVMFRALVEMASWAP